MINPHTNTSCTTLTMYRAVECRYQPYPIYCPFHDHQPADPARDKAALQHCSNCKSKPAKSAPQAPVHPIRVCSCVCVCVRLPRAARSRSGSLTSPHLRICTVILRPRGIPPTTPAAPRQCTLAAFFSLPFFPLTTLPRLKRTPPLPRE